MTESCDECPQSCVMTHWGPWSHCVGGCRKARKYRRRQILVAADPRGAECNTTIEIEHCRREKHCRDQRPRHQWKVGEWTSCRKTPESTTCGTGLRFRAVTCTNRRGKQVLRKHCLNRKGHDEPPRSEVCVLPCDCQVSPWSGWSPCSQTCYGGQTGLPGDQSRRRQIDRMPENGGLDCPQLAEKRHCRNSSLPVCLRYKWLLSAWSMCKLLTYNSTCGPGIQWREVACRLEGSSRHVAETRCLEGQSKSLSLPSKERACQVPCPQNCELGMWQNWSPCSKSCGPGAIQKRQRPVLKPARYGGKQCGQSDEIKQCENIPCVWWYTGSWSVCYMDVNNVRCGTGSQIRVVYCMSSLDEYLVDGNCSHLPKPADRRHCTKPCPQQCELSPWSEWSLCTKSCGIQGGTQYRKREIEVNQSGGKCVEDYELTETQLCNQIPCERHYWQYSAWSTCEGDSPNNRTGLQTRHVFCEKVPGYKEGTKLCDETTRPADSQVCRIPEPQDCVMGQWSDWSACSQSCGTESSQMRVRTVMIHAMHGGNSCPPNTDENGAEAEHRICPNLPRCPVFYWISRPWQVCKVPLVGCGIGIQKRDVICFSDGKEVDPANCLKLAGAPPDNQRRCFKPCAGDCVLSPWSDFGPCSQSCGDSPGFMIRTRSLVNLDSRINATVQCPHIKRTDLTERLECGVEPCPVYSWQTGTWGSCMLNDGHSTCGMGVQARPVSCVIDGAEYTQSIHCQQTLPMPIRRRTCHVPCPGDCQLSPWSQWESCSAKCGQGLQKRTRLVIIPVENGGRPCGPIVDTRHCEDIPCENFLWRTTDWDICKVKFGLTCGDGVQRRRVTCPAGDESLCEQRMPRLATERSCNVVCKGNNNNNDNNPPLPATIEASLPNDRTTNHRGNCIQSPWSEFGQCQCTERGNDKIGRRMRTRKTIREPMPGGYACGPLVESEECPCYRYKVVVGDWSSCQFNRNNDCGRGQRMRPVQCVREAGIFMPLYFCNTSSITVRESCHTPCAVDCRVGRYTRWTTCSGCGPTKFKTRRRSITRNPNKRGRACPGSEILEQTTTCGLEPCVLYTYSWYRGPWSSCNVEGDGCGFGERHRVVQCRRSDGVAVQNIHCLIKGSKGNLASIDLSKLDLRTTQPCGSPCPHDCMVTEWSPFGPCYRDCSNADGTGIKIRTRSIIKPAERGGLACPSALKEFKSCHDVDMLCPSFQWIIDGWIVPGEREIYCVTQGGARVTGGCSRSRRPDGNWNCNNECSREAECHYGKCQCNQGFEGDGRVCYPKMGCLSDQHCPINESYCDIHRSVCQCKDGSLPLNNITCNYRQALTRENQASKGLSNAIWIAIAVGSIVIIMLMVLSLIFICSRRRFTGHLSLTATQTSRTNNVNNHSPSKMNNDLHCYTTTEYRDHEKNNNACQNGNVRVENGGTRHSSLNLPDEYNHCGDLYKVYPRTGVWSSNFYLPINTDDLDDEVFTDDTDDVFMDPRLDLEDDVFAADNSEERLEIGYLFPKGGVKLHPTQAPPAYRRGRVVVDQPAFCTLPRKPATSRTSSFRNDGDERKMRHHSQDSEFRNLTTFPNSKCITPVRTPSGAADQKKRFSFEDCGLPPPPPTPDSELLDKSATAPRPPRRRRHACWESPDVPRRELPLPPRNSPTAVVESSSAIPKFTSSAELLDALHKTKRGSNAAMATTDADFGYLEVIPSSYEKNLNLNVSSSDDEFVFNDDIAAAMKTSKSTNGSIVGNYKVKTPNPSPTTTTTMSSSCTDPSTHEYEDLDGCYTDVSRFSDTTTAN
ncbi:thrombospondin type-1 domain-containing protein 7B-like [Tubulanus polymorphus]|uniref:thrombospondin type-1 domain-containing protein 7B-like n=1 Tax=Tubulanus polymorphus TaxID=672921 RepID=UPI003DA69336